MILRSVLIGLLIGQVAVYLLHKASRNGWL